MQDAFQHIISDPKVMLGKPVIKGTRIPVYIVLNLLAEGLSHTEIIKKYPDLTNEAVFACLTYASRRAQYQEESVLESQA